MNTEARLQRANKVEALIYSFPSLSEADPPLYPLEAERLTTWAGQYDKIQGPMAYWAARFVLSVCLDGWAGFDAVQAVRAWDYAHRSAFIRWIQRPFFGGLKGNRPTTSMMKPAETRPKDQGKKWSEADNLTLRVAWERGVSVDVIAEQLKRSIGGIAHRVVLLGFADSVDEVLSNRNGRRTLPVIEETAAGIGHSSTKKGTP